MGIMNNSKLINKKKKYRLYYDKNSKTKSENEISKISQNDNIHPLDNYDKCRPLTSDKDNNFNQRCINSGILGTCKQVLAEDNREYANIKTKQEYIDFIGKTIMRRSDSKENDGTLLGDWLSDACNEHAKNWHIDTQLDVEKYKNLLVEKNKLYENLHSKYISLNKNYLELKSDSESKINSNCEDILKKKDELLTVYTQKIDSLIEESKNSEKPDEKILELQQQLLEFDTIKEKSKELSQINKELKLKISSLEREKQILKDKDEKLADCESKIENLEISIDKLNKQKSSLEEIKLKNIEEADIMKSK